MPLFRRPDGDLITDESPVRRMIPYLMRGRNESAVYHDEVIDISKVRPWMRAWNQSHPGDAITLFHIFLFGISRGFHARPGMNRFSSGGRLYQRRGFFLSFAAKKRFDDKAALVTVKVEYPENEPFIESVRKVKNAIGEGRGDAVTTVDKELKLALALRFLDKVNLMPGAMLKTDPMYTSAFVANLGSVLLDRTYHHLYEYGTASLFCVIGPPKKIPVVIAGDQIVVREVVEMRWTFDERIHDGFYCALALKHFARVLEDPDKYIGSPTEGADKELPAAAAT
jgi:2-oxoacid dehydrogenases acyltransferase (catalytic domain)